MIFLLACQDDAPAATPISAETSAAAPAQPHAAGAPSKAGPPLGCDEAPATPSPRGCVTGDVLSCDSVVTGTTAGGDAVIDNDFYVHAFCFPRSDGHHNGPERVYRVLVPEYQQATITLDSPCVDLDLVAVAYDWAGTCPSEEALVSECEANTRRSGGKLRIDVFNPREYLVIVDGKDGAVGPYTLDVKCTPIRRPGDK